MASSSESNAATHTKKPLYAATLDCVHCGLCLPTCPTYQVLGNEADSPRGRIYLMRALAEGRVAEPATIQPFLDRCLDCRACETACPSGVQYGTILANTRAAMTAKSPPRGIRAWLVRQLLRRIVAVPARLRRAFAWLAVCERLGLRRLAEWCRLIPAPVRQLAPRVPTRHARRPLASGVHPPSPTVQARGITVGLFTGCVQEQLFGEVNRATLQLLLANGFRVLVPAAQRCCGALLAHAGQTDDAKALAEANVQAFAEVDFVIHNAAGCGCAMKEYGHLLGHADGVALASKCRDLAEFLAEQGLSATPAPRHARAVYDDPCHLCHGQGVRQQPRELLAQVPGLELIPHEGAEDCCGSAGIYNLLQPELAHRLGERKAQQILAANADLVLTANPGCMLQLRATLRAAGSAAQVQHVAEVLLP